MSLEDKIEEVIGAIEGLTSVMERLEKAGGQVAETGEIIEEIVEPPVKRTTKKKTSKKKTSKKKTAKRTAPSHTAEEVLEALKSIDRESAKAVLREFSVSKLSELKPADYGKAIESANQYVGEEEEDDEDLLG